MSPLKQHVQGSLHAIGQLSCAGAAPGQASERHGLPDRDPKRIQRVPLMATGTTGTPANSAK